MKLYKFKSFDQDGFLYVIDMIVNERVYLSSCDAMNDVDEGNWECVDQEKSNSYLLKAKELREIVGSQRFTCFVESINNPLMWAHYAGGFSGVAFEYELDSAHDLRKIVYEGVPRISLEDMDKVLSGHSKPQDIGVLKQKAKCWTYEDEWRLYGRMNSCNYIEKIKPCGVIFGPKSTKYTSVISNILNKYGIKVGYMVPTDEEEYTVEYIP